MHSTADLEQKFLTPSQAAKVLNVSLSTLKKFIYSGKLKTLKTPGGHHRIRESDLYSQVRKDEREEHIDDSIISMAEAFIEIFHNRQKFCKDHAAHVSDICRKISESMGFGDQRIERLCFAARVHDIGVCGIDNAIWNKESELTEQEYEQIKFHPVLGANIFVSLKNYRDISIFIRQHHERWDGKGYPHGLKGTQIALEARILGVAESYAAMTAEDSYKAQYSEHQARAEIAHQAGKQFDPEVVEYFLRI